MKITLDQNERRVLLEELQSTTLTEQQVINRLQYKGMKNFRAGVQLAIAEIEKAIQEMRT